jgi:predicted deacetylase
MHETRSLCIVLHDVTPATWPLYRHLVHAIDSLGRVPLTLLVVPDFQRRLPLDCFPEFRGAIEKRLARGDEVALHGYHHDLDLPPAADAADFLLRRILARDAEFHRLDEDAAAQRLRRGLSMLHDCGWPVSGFVAPAWLMSAGTQAALRRSPLLYTSTPSGLIRLPEWHRIDAPALLWSSGSAWRRMASRCWNRRLMRHSASSPLLRLGLHPADMRHREVVRYWLAAIEDLLVARTPRTKAQWVHACPV